MFVLGRSFFGHIITYLSPLYALDAYQFRSGGYWLRIETENGYKLDEKPGPCYPYQRSVYPARVPPADCRSLDTANRMLMLKPINKEKIGSEFRSELSVQEYGKKTPIEGVQIITLQSFVDDGGALAEIVRVDENGYLVAIPQFKVRQSTWSQMVPGTIKAFHLHYNQEDVWFIMPYDRLLIGLFDAREDSPTYKQTMRFVLGAGRAQILYLPRGVAHGLANPWNQTANMIYFVNQWFDAEHPDEQRLPWNILGDDFWEIKKG